MAVRCFVLICIAVWVALSFERADEQQKSSPQFALQLLHYTDLPALYEHINGENFDGELPGDVAVSWADVRSDPRCGKCGAMTTYDSGKPVILIDTERVRTKESLRELMQHEMCHVSVFEAEKKGGNAAFREMDDQPHGPLWQACMKRFE